MIAARNTLLGALCVLGLGFAWFFWRALRRTQPPRMPSWIETGIGFLTDFLDTLGIGSFAVTTSLYRAGRLVPDRVLPGTLNVGHALPTVLEALIYISIIEVDGLTLAALIGAALLGAYFGAGAVSGWSERKVRIALGTALLLAALLMVARTFGLLPAGSDRLALRGAALWVGVACNFALGALMTFGIGLYAPCMVLVALLGMNPKSAFPIMMGSCAFLMPVASLRFVRANSYAPRAALGLTLGGLPGVWLAAHLVKELDLGLVRWLVVIVVLFTGASLLRAGLGRGAPR